MLFLQTGLFCVKGPYRRLTKLISTEARLAQPPDCPYTPVWPGSRSTLPHANGLSYHLIYVCGYNPEDIVGRLVWGNSRSPTARILLFAHLATPHHLQTASELLHRGRVHRQTQFVDRMVVRDRSIRTLISTVMPPYRPLRVLPNTSLGRRLGRQVPSGLAGPV